MPQSESTLTRQNLLSMTVVLGFITVLFYEWLRPLPSIDGAHSLPLFLLFFIFIMMIKLLQIPSYVHIVLGGFVLLFITHYTYFVMPFFSFEWVPYFRDELVLAVSMLFTGNGPEISFVARTFFFLLIIWYVAIYLYYAVLFRNRILIFLVLTICYVSILNTFTAYDGNLAIVRIFVIGFLLLAFVQILHVRQFEQPPPKSSSGVMKPRFPYGWFAMGMVVIMAAAMIGYAMPKAEPSWPDPVYFVQNYSEDVVSGIGTSGIRRSGYGDNDSVLGGPLIEDESIAFYAETESTNYWRGESKDFYTGRGWESTADEIITSIDQMLTVWPSHERLYVQDDQDSISVTVRFENGSSRVFYQGDVLFIEPTPHIDNLKLITSSGSITFLDGSPNRPEIEEYELVNMVPRFSIEALRAADMNDAPESIQETYTQLPGDLPERIGQLVQEETAHMTSAYEKVKWAESYFVRNGFEYATSDISVPGRGQDYVDQFLFETQRGYCDNYSSAMVVMLRTLDIPARWVKGFTQGELESQEDGVYDTIVRNKNAHSWVEVYFPGTGWVPFEPTQTFSNPYDFELDASAEDGQNENDDPFQDNENNDTTADNEELGGAGRSEGGWVSPFWIGIFGGMAFLVTLFLLFFYWRRLILSWAIYRYHQMEGSNRFFLAHEVLIRYLGRFVHKKKESQTMREYIRSLEPHFETQALRPLNDIFETMRYGSDQHDPSIMRRAKRLWRSVMKKMH